MTEARITVRVNFVWNLSGLRLESEKVMIMDTSIRNSVSLRRRE